MNEKVSNKIANGGIIAAAMVVGIHVCDGGPTGSLIWWWDRLLHYGVFLIAVPFFFVCSGYFLCRHYARGRMLEVWREEMWKRVKSLLVPFLIWSAIGICLYEMLPVRLAANLMHGREAFANFPEGWHFWTKGFGIYPYDFPMLFPLWYVRALLIFVVFSPLLFKLIEKLGGREYARFCISYGHC